MFLILFLNELLVNRGNEIWGTLYFDADSDVNLISIFILMLDVSKKKGYT